MHAALRVNCAGAALACLLVARPSPVASHNPTQTTVRFDREIVSLLNQKCVACHTADGLAMPLQTYADVRPWATAIKDEVIAHRMPPWPAERGYGTFANDISLTRRERDFLLSWIDGGARPGAIQPAPPPDHGTHWMLGEPDVLTSSWSPAGSPRPGVSRFTIDPGLTRDTWIRALDFKPGDRKTIRAAFFSVAGTDQQLGGWTPWAQTFAAPAGAAMLLPAGRAVTVDVVHGPGASPAAAPRLGLYVAPAPPQPITTLVLRGQTRAGHTLTQARVIVSLRVSMGAGGRSFELKAKRPDGSTEPLLLIRDFSQDWQTPFVLQSPVVLPPRSVLVASATFDPSGIGAPTFEVFVNAR